MTSSILPIRICLLFSSELSIQQISKPIKRCINSNIVFNLRHSTIISVCRLLFKTAEENLNGKRHPHSHRYRAHIIQNIHSTGAWRCQWIEFVIGMYYVIVCVCVCVLSHVASMAYAKRNAMHMKILGCAHHPPTTTPYRHISANGARRALSMLLW